MWSCKGYRCISILLYYTIQCEDLSDSQHFEKENISEAYEYFSDAATSNPIEQGGFLLEDGSIFIISDANNAADTTRYPKLNDKNNDGYAYIALPPDGRLLKVFGIIHTHPNKNTAGYEYKPKSPEDWNSLASIGGNHPDHRIDIQGYIYTPDGIYTYWFQSDGTRSYMDPNRNYFHNQ